MTSAIFGKTDEAESRIAAADFFQQFRRPVGRMVVGQNYFCPQRGKPPHEGAQTRDQCRKHGLFVVDRDDNAEFGTAHRVHQIRF